MARESIPEPDIRLADEIGVDAPDFDENALPDEIRFELEVERRVLHYHHIGMDREKMLAHMCYRRMDVLKERIAKFEQEDL